LDREIVVPDNILVLLSIQNNIIVRGITLVRTRSDGGAGTKEGRVNRGEGEVIANFEASLVEMQSVGGFGDGFAADADFNRASGGEDIDALEGILGVAKDGDVFLEPFVFR
jgi:hypothetical protein